VQPGAGVEFIVAVAVGGEHILHGMAGAGGLTLGLLHADHRLDVFGLGFEHAGP
jgi:hypothetical protein